MQGYPLLNFCLTTALYVFVSFRLFNITNNLKFLLLPLNDNKWLLYNCCIAAGLGLASYIVALGVQFTVMA